MSEGPEHTERQRQAIVASYPTGESGIAEQLDQLAALAARLCDAPTGLVSLVEEHRQRFVGRAGTDLLETPREQSFCAVAMLGSDAMVVPDAAADQRFRTNPLVTGAPGIRFYAAWPLKSAEGAAIGAICVIDTVPRDGLTPRQIEDLRTLGNATMALLERGRIDHSSRKSAAVARSAIHDLEQRFHVLADAMPQMVWSSLPSGYSDYFNSRWCSFVGTTAESCHGDAWMRFLHPDDLDRTAEVWRGAVNSGGVYEIEYRLRHHDEGYRWVLARGLPMRDEAGLTIRWLGTCTDIHEQKAESEQKELLTRELSHRIKNIFAVIGGLLTMSMRRNPDLAPLARDLQGRVLALGRAHDFVRPQNQKSRVPMGRTSLVRMLESLLAPYRTADEERITIRGGDVDIDDRSATPLALLFHELATNAAKYGALSIEEGRVEIVIGQDDDIALEWIESGGPPVATAGERGFGGELIEMSVTRQLGGALRYDWRREGLRVTATVPCRAMAR